MSKEIYISATPHETRLAIVENDALAEIYYERENEYTLAGSIYNGKVTRVLPGMQSSFVDIGLERDAFLYITDFMEEAGDSADFESNANAGDSRASRNDKSGGDRSGGGRNGRDRNGRERSGQDEQPRLPAPETSDADFFTQAVSGPDPGRPAEGERSDRGGSRRGGRNRRDRAFNSDGTPRRDRSEVSRSDAARPVLVQTEAAPEVVPESVDAPNDQLGEASPAADGSRRWRGRRGRRGNRSREDAGQAIQAGEPVSTTQTYIDEGYDEPAYEIGASAAPPMTLDRAPGEDRGNRADRGDRNGRDRGSRNRRDRGPQQPPRVPRGFTPSLDLYKVDAGADETLPEIPYRQEVESASPIEPLILPGESLSKYRPGSSTPTSQRVEAAPAPTSEFTLTGAWDGGFVLPGETIRPRGPASSSVPSRFEDRGPRRDDRGGRDNRGGRNDRHNPGETIDRGGRPERDLVVSRPGFQSDRASLQIEPQELSQPVCAADPGEPSHETHSVALIHSTFVPPPPVPATDAFEPFHEAPGTFAADHTLAVAEPVHVSEPEFEFEPTEASASFRVDPVPPSEYRQSVPVLEFQVEESPFPESHFDEPDSETPSSLAEPEAAVDLLPGLSAETKYESTLPTLHGVIPAHGDYAHEVPAAVAEFTSINELGEMHSEPMIVSPEHIHESDPSAPIGHESAIVSGEPMDMHRTSGLLSFAPGDGHLEEEELVDDEDHLHLHASAFHDQETARDQETLEGVADLGTMLREMSIDNITRPEPSALDEEDEDDLEEDFLEEDQLEDDDSLASEYAEEDSPEELESHEIGEPGEPLGEAEERVYASDFEVTHPAPSGDSLTADVSSEPRRERGREDRGRRDGRRGDRSRRDGRGDRDRSSTSGSSSNGDRDRSRDSRDSRGGRNSRQSMQSTNLPAISDLLKPGQEILCQIAKEPIAKKGARITSHIALPGRFLVFMPTVHHTGVSRKIESDSERRRLKEILISERGEASGGFIVRTAAEGASEEELRSDLRFLLNLWTDIKTRSESSKSPALIYHDLNLIERVLRDQVTDNFSAIWVDTEAEYERVLRFLQRFQPSLIRRVKLYTKETPLFEQFGITEEINKALRSKVWLKSGGSIVINQTEALVAIDINTGKFVGKTARLEDTIVKTNLDAIPEIVRQIRLRDLGGIIIIDFIDMDERKNRNKVMAALEEELKSDRAPSKVLQFNDFGLVAITRKRVKQSLERTLSTTCGVCQGTGMVKSPVSVCNDIYIEMRKMHKHLDRGDVMLRVHPEVVKQLKSSTKWLQEMEEMCGKTILVKSDPSLHPEQFDIH